MNESFCGRYEMAYCAKLDYWSTARATYLVRSVDVAGQKTCTWREDYPNESNIILISAMCVKYRYCC